MTKKDLQDFRRNLREVELIQEQLKRLWSQMEGVRSSQISDMPKPPHTHDKLGELYAKYDPIYNKYIKRLTSLYAEQERIEAEINKKLEGVEKEIIRCRYLLDMDIFDICERIGYERTQYYFYEKQAIEKLEK